MMRQQRWMGWVALVFVAAGACWGQIPINPTPTNFTSTQIVPQDAGCKWRVRFSGTDEVHSDGPRTRRTFLGFGAAAEGARAKVESALIGGEAGASDSTMTDSAQAAASVACPRTYTIQRIQACAAPQPVISINYSTSFRVTAKVSGAASSALATGTVTATVSELGFKKTAKGTAQVSSVAVPAGVVLILGIPVPVYASSTPVEQTLMAPAIGSASRANITAATLLLQSSVQVGTHADAMLGFFKTVAEAFVGAHIMAFEFTGRCDNCGGRVDVRRT